MSHFTCLNSVCVIFWVGCVNGTTFFVVLNIYNLPYFVFCQNFVLLCNTWCNR